jgi:outer membrane biosynthesis protein TonB
MKKLHQGEQFSTASTETMTPLTEAIAWSRRATELVALLPSPPAATPEAPVVAYTPAPSPRRLSRTVVIPPPEQAQEAPQPAPTQPTPEPTPEPTPAPTPEPTAAPQPSPGGAPAPVPGPEGPPSLRRPVPDLGAQIAARECGGCHVPEMGQQAYTNRAAVEAVVSRMTSYGARVSQSEFPVLVDYLLRTYNGPARPAR